MKKKFFGVLIFSIFYFQNLSYCQVGPPKMAMPNDKAIKIIDQILEITKFETYFINYCSNRVLKFSEKNKWPSEKTREILSSIKFKYFKTDIYNNYAFYTIIQLKTLLNALQLLNKNENTPLVLTSSMLQNNLDLFIESVIEGKYFIKE
jgi:hypothetical protein